MILTALCLSNRISFRGCGAESGRENGSAQRRRRTDMPTDLPVGDIERGRYRRYPEICKDRRHGHGNRICLPADGPSPFPGCSDFEFMTTALTAQQLLAQNGNVVIIADTPDAREALRALQRLSLFIAYRITKVQEERGRQFPELAATRKALAAGKKFLSRAK